MRIDATGCSLVPGFVDAVSPTEPGPDTRDEAGDWALAHGTTTWLAAARRTGVTLLAPVEILLRTRADLSVARPEPGDRPVALTAVTRVSAGLQVASMPYALSLACLALGLSFGAALTAATLNAAWAIGRDDDRGSLEAGKRLDVVVVGGAPERLVAAGAPAVRMVIRGGRVANWVQGPGRREA
jgi:imidazolonepropionase-like amidohydrolase